VTGLQREGGEGGACQRGATGNVDVADDPCGGLPPLWRPPKTCTEDVCSPPNRTKGEGSNEGWDNLRGMCEAASRVMGAKTVARMAGSS